MKYLIALVSLGILLLVYMFIQAMSYKTRHYELSGGAEFRFLHITDIHIGLLFISSSRIKKTIIETKPDFILISGDFLDCPKHIKKLEKWLKGIESGIRTYAVLGNHDHRCFISDPNFKNEFMRLMKSLNIQILINETVVLNDKNNSSVLALVGLDDCKTGILFDKKIFEGLKDKYKFVLAFSHNPDVSLHIPEGSVDLFVAGHFHGGQIWLPFNLEYMLLRKEKVCRMGHIKGFAAIRNNMVYISRGLGTVLVPFRFFSVPEITVFDIKP
ncbi:MAG: metallophosphoesterase [Clostridiaceae bacterium]|nr:metallophosphoesterase [Clostridiaceae bacterium]